MEDIKLVKEPTAVRNSRKAAWLANAVQRDAEEPKRQLEDNLAINAVVSWLAAQLGVPLAQAQAEVSALYNTRKAEKEAT